MDDDDKTRRNLVVVSAAVVSLAWLELPTGAVVARIFGDPIADKLSQSRLWSLVVAVLVYLVLRFRFSVDTEAAVEDARTQWRTLKEAKIKNIIVSHLARYSRRGIDSPIFFEELKTLVPKQDPDFGRPTFSVELVHPGSDGWPVTVISNLAWQDKLNNRHISRANLSFGAVFGLSLRIRVLARSLFETSIYSRASIHILFPLLLAAVALLSAAARLLWSLI